MRHISGVMETGKKTDNPGKWEVWTVNTPSGTRIGLVVGYSGSFFRVMPIVGVKGPNVLKISEPRFIGLSGDNYLDRTEHLEIPLCDMVSRMGRLGKADLDLATFIRLDA